MNRWRTKTPTVYKNLDEDILNTYGFAGDLLASSVRVKDPKDNISLIQMT